jgi:hypothetical protein
MGRSDVGGVSSVWEGRGQCTPVVESRSSMIECDPEVPSVIAGFQLLMSFV